MYINRAITHTMKTGDTSTWEVRDVNNQCLTICASNEFAEYTQKALKDAGINTVIVEMPKEGLTKIN